jgi:hypothetical protein
MKTSLTTLCARLLLLALAGAACSAHAGFNPPSMVSYQGYLTDGTGAPLGNTNTGPKNYALVFKIYNSQTGSATNNLLYSEQQIVTVDKGYFSCVLGIGTVYGTDPHPDLTLLFPSTLATPLYVETTVLGTPNIVILPRLQLVTSPFSFLANNAVNAQNLINSSNSSVLTISGNSLTIGNTNSYLNVNGTINATAANITGAINAGSATITNTVTAGTVSAAIVYAGTATVTNAFTAGSASIPGAINAGSATVTNTLTAANAVITNTLTAGTLQATTATVTNLTVTSTASIGNLNVTGTNSSAYFKGDGGGITNVPTLDEPNLRMIRGRVTSVGLANGATNTILLGKGFTATKAGLGYLMITFTVPFSDVPVVVASDEGGGGYKSIVGTLTRTNFYILTARNYLNNGDADSTINFIAIGPK